MDRTFNTLFMLSSVDGKISTGTGKRDFDLDFPKIRGLKEGLFQYYELEKRTDICSFNSGKVMAKIGVNSNKNPVNCPKVSFVIADNTHLKRKGIENLAKNTKKLFVVTSNKKHPVFKLKENSELKEKIEIVFYSKKIDFANLFEKLKKEFRIKRVTIQSGGTLNSILLRSNLIDRVSIVIAPALIGGKETSSLVDGKSLLSEKDLKKIKALKLIKCEKLKKDYLHLVYSLKN